MELEARRFVVRGRVQGVGFRAWTRALGRRLGLTGTVRNLPDGRSVEALAQGPRDALARFAAALRQGPPGSFVAEFHEEPWPLDQQLDGFEVTH